MKRGPYKTEKTIVYAMLYSRQITLTQVIAMDDTEALRYIASKWGVELTEYERNDYRRLAVALAKHAEQETHKRLKDKA